MGSPALWLRMLILRVDLGDVGRNCAMYFSARSMCLQVWMPECGLQMFAQTLPALPVRQEWLVHEVLASAEGFSGVVVRGCVVVRKNPPARARLLMRKTGAI